MLMSNQNCGYINIQPSFPNRDISLSGSCNNVIINKELSSVTINGNCCSISSSTPIHKLKINGSNNIINSFSAFGDIIINGHNCSLKFNQQCKSLKINGSNNSITCLLIQERIINNGANNQIFVISQNQVHFSPQQNGMSLFNGLMNLWGNGNQGGNVNNEGNQVHQREVNRQQNATQMDEQRRKQMLEIRKDIIKNLKEFPYKNVKKEMKKDELINKECSICLEKFKENDKLVLFNCDVHYFHKKCIMDWLKKSNFCPLCKRHLMVDILEPGEDLKL